MESTRHVHKYLFKKYDRDAVKTDQVYQWQWRTKNNDGLMSYFVQLVNALRSIFRNSFDFVHIAKAINTNHMPFNSNSKPISIKGQKLFVTRQVANDRENRTKKRQTLEQIEH